MNKRIISDDRANLAYFSVEHSSEMVFWVRKDGSFFYLNPAARKALGYTMNEIHQLRVTDILLEYEEGDRNKLRSKIDQDLRHVVRANLRKKDGGIMPVESINNSMRIGNEVFNCAFVRDITDRLLAEQKMIAAHVEPEREDLSLKSRYMISDRLNIIGNSKRLLDVLERASRFAGNDRPVLITGESGVGKESMARFINATSLRSEKEMITINCALLTENTIISKLFGHVKGAFTGAYQKRAGIFGSANGGTLFLDEVGELSLDVQAMLLRVLETGRYSRMGENKVRETDVRIIAATNRDLREMIAEKKFREDLFFRINVLRIEVPPLRKRRSDIPLLIKYKLKELNRSHGAAKQKPNRASLKVLTSHQFPGNIRELFNIVERAYFSEEDDQISFPEDLFHKYNHENHGANGRTLASVERHHIKKIVEQCNGRISGVGGAAEILGLKRTTLMSKMKKLGLR